MTAPQPSRGPDLAARVALTDIADGGLLAGHVGNAPVLLACRGDDVLAPSRCANKAAR